MGEASLSKVNKYNRRIYTKRAYISLTFDIVHQDAHGTVKTESAEIINKLSQSRTGVHH